VAQRLITEGRVTVRGVPSPKPATLVGGDAAIDVIDEPSRFVGRGGEKLQGALEVFPVTTEGASALDVGASTGGFTDCLLQAGAAHVVALDVGYGQLHWKVRSDERVTVVERTNVRHVDPGAIGAPFDVIVVDVSFISVAMIAPQLAACGQDGTDYVILVKPQFEVGKNDVGKGGIVRDPEVHQFAITSAARALEKEGVGVLGAVASPIMGTKGNREFLLWCRKGAPGIDAEVAAKQVAP
jgi:23S rRNA (cytidine1920-2'-O)/16S rRNA (cytidine1409-2'-O)-methyltransferase